MFVHTTTVNADPDRFERGIAYVETQVMEELRDFAGFVGLSMLVDRTIGRAITASAWETASAMHGHVRDQQALHTDYFGRIGGREPVAQEWEVALLHRDHPSRPSAYAQVTWLECPAEAIDGFVASLRLSLPELETMPGYCNTSLLVDRSAGTIAETVTYDSLGTLSQNRGNASTIRTGAADESEAEVMEVEEFELAIAHLRVPELV